MAILHSYELQLSPSTMTLRVSFLFYLAYTYALHGNTLARTVSKNNDIEDYYYWRDYKGYIPSDAVPGGSDNKGRTTYIGQVLHNNFLIPAQIDEVGKGARFEWGFQEFTTSEDVKVLCTNRPEVFEWIKTSADRFKKEDNSRFVAGGSETKNGIYLGRVDKDGEVLVGKLVVNEDVILHTTQAGKAIQSSTFEVLAYRPEKAKRESPVFSCDTIDRAVRTDAANARTECGKGTVIVNFN